MQPSARAARLRKALQQVALRAPNAPYGPVKSKSDAAGEWRVWVADATGAKGAGIVAANLQPEDVLMAVHCMGVYRHSRDLAMVLAEPAFKCAAALGAKSGLLLPGFARVRVVAKALFDRIAACLLVPEVLPRVAPSNAAGVFWACSVARLRAEGLGLLPALAINTARGHCAGPADLPHVTALVKAARPGGLPPPAAGVFFTALAEQVRQLCGGAARDEVRALLVVLRRHPARGDGLDRCVAAIVRKEPLLVADLPQKEQRLCVQQAGRWFTRACVEAVAPLLHPHALLELLRGTMFPQSTFPAVRSVAFDAWPVLLAFAQVLRQRCGATAPWGHVTACTARLVRDSMFRLGAPQAVAFIDSVPHRHAHPDFLAAVLPSCTPWVALKTMRGARVVCPRTLMKAVGELGRADAFARHGPQEAAVLVGMAGGVEGGARVFEQFAKRLSQASLEFARGYAGGAVFTTAQLFRAARGYLEADAALPPLLRRRLADRTACLPQELTRRPQRGADAAEHARYLMESFACYAVDLLEACGADPEVLAPHSGSPGPVLDLTGPAAACLSVVPLYPELVQECLRVTAELLCREGAATALAPVVEAAARRFPPSDLGWLYASLARAARAAPRGPLAEAGLEALVLVHHALARLEPVHYPREGAGLVVAVWGRSVWIPRGRLSPPLQTALTALGAGGDLSAGLTDSCYEISSAVSAGRALQFVAEHLVAPRPSLVLKGVLERQPRSVLDVQPAGYQDLVLQASVAAGGEDGCAAAAALSFATTCAPMHLHGLAAWAALEGALPPAAAAGVVGTAMRRCPRILDSLLDALCQGSPTLPGAVCA